MPSLMHGRVPYDTGSVRQRSRDIKVNFPLHFVVPILFVVDWVPNCLKKVRVGLVDAPDQF